MKHKNTFIILLTCGCLLVGAAFSVVSPSQARIYSTSIWRGRIAENITERSLEDEGKCLLIEGGQTVLLGEVDGTICIPLNLPDSGKIAVKVSDVEWVNVEQEDAYLTITSYLQREVIVEEEPDKGSDDTVKEEPTEEEPTEEEPTEEEPTEEEPTEEEPTEEEPTEEEPTEEEPTEEEPTEEEPTEEEPTEKEPTEEEPTEEEPTEKEPTEEESSEKEPTEEESTEKGPTEEESTEKEPTEDESTGGNLTDGESSTEDKEPVPEEGTGNASEEKPKTEIEYRPNTVSLEVVWKNSGAECRSATFVLTAQREFMQNGEICLDSELNCYNPNIPIIMETESAGTLTLDDGEFPQWTKYTVDGERYLIYTPTVIQFPADARIVLDLSLTGLEEEAIKISGIKLHYYELSDIELNEKLHVLGNLGSVFDTFYSWGSIEPTVTFKRKEITDNSFHWVEDQSIQCVGNEDNRVYISPSGAQAGTYRLCMNWVDRDVELYALEIPFYIFYENILELS